MHERIDRIEWNVGQCQKPQRLYIDYDMFNKHTSLEMLGPMSWLCSTALYSFFFLSFFLFQLCTYNKYFRDFILFVSSY